jgi:hypothetical protein
MKLEHERKNIVNLVKIPFLYSYHHNLKTLIVLRRLFKIVAMGTSFRLAQILAAKVNITYLHFGRKLTNHKI